MRSKARGNVFSVACFAALVLFAGVLGLSRVFAGEMPFEISDVVVSQKSETATGDVVGFSDHKINNNIVFHQVGDSITYKITLKNISSDARIIDDVSSDYQGELFVYEFDSHAADRIEPNETFDFVLKTTYVNAVSDVEKRSQNLEIKFVFKFSDGSETTIVIANPSTWDNISLFGVIFASCIIGLLALIVFRLKRVDPSKKVVMMGALLVIACLPLPFVNAVDGAYDVSIENAITLNDELLVRFMDQGAEVSNVVVKYSDRIEAPMAPEKEGYYLDCWLTAEGGCFDFTVPISSDIELSAFYAPNNYKVAFDGNGATSGAMPVQTMVYDEPKNLIVNQFEKNEYDFVGWNTKADGTGVGIDGGAEVMNLIDKGTIMLYAQWAPSTYAVVFNNNGGSGEMDVQKFVKGASQKLTKSTFVKEDYAFWYWSTKADGTGVKYTDEQSVKDLVPLGQTIELYAIYSRERYEYSGDIVFDGKNYVDTDVYLFNDRNINRDFVITFEIENYASSGDFATMVNSMDESGAPYVGITCRFNKDGKFVFIANSSSSARAENKYDVSKKKKVIIKRVGKTLYFALDDDADTEFSDLSLLSKTFDIPVTFGASLDGEKNPWRFFIGTLSNLKVELLDENEQTGKIRFNANGGTGAMNDQSVADGQTVRIKKNTFVRDGYVLKNWSTKADGTGDRYDNEEMVSNLVGAGEEIILYAQWTTYSYKIVFNANGGTGTMPVQHMVSTVAKSLNKSTLSRDGYDFAFWNTRADGTGKVYQDEEIVDNLVANANGTATLYAFYEKDSYSHSGDMVFDGTNYVNAEMYLFSKRNIHRDFELSFYIKNIEGGRKQDTIVGAIDETGSPWPGFVFRLGSTNANQLEIEANAVKGSEVTKRRGREIGIKVVIKRIDDVLYAKIGDDAETQVIDYSNMPRPFYAPLAIGASLNGSLKPQRQFTGILSDISARFLN